VWPGFGGAPSIVCAKRGSRYQTRKNKNKFKIFYQILGAAFDTGFFQGICSLNQTCGGFYSGCIAKCDAWPPGHRVVGVPPYLNHLLIPFLKFYNATESLVGDSYPYYKLARLLVRLLSRKTYFGGDDALKLMFLENTLGYFELNPIMQINFKRGIKMLIGMFDFTWGNELGQQVREFAVANDWVLAWAYNPTMSFRCGPSAFKGCKIPKNFSEGIDAANVRILDPWVLQQVSAGYNVSVDSNMLENFETQFQKLNVTLASSKEISAGWDLLDRSFGRSKLSIEPLYYNACANDDCVGITLEGVCVCSNIY
jgi:hypothetical protein